MELKPRGWRDTTVYILKTTGKQLVFVKTLLKPISVKTGPCEDGGNPGFR
jgi:hypothetical protein